jgi:DNA-binding transcriptional ArsR family regulator
MLRYESKYSSAIERMSQIATSAALARPAEGHGDADIAVVGALVADPSRCRILLALDDGRALPASRLASEAGVSAATASSHPGKLTSAGPLVAEAHGRNRYYRLAGPAVGQLIEALQHLAASPTVRSLRQDTRASALRAARTCYDHLAGRLGVALMASLLEAGHLAGGDGTFDPATARHDQRTGYGRDVDYTLTDSGHRSLTEFGVGLQAAAEPSATASTRANSATTSSARSDAACSTASLSVAGFAEHRAVAPCKSLTRAERLVDQDRRTPVGRRRAAALMVSLQAERVSYSWRLASTSCMCISAHSLMSRITCWSERPRSVSS